MQAQREMPPDMQCKDKFLVQSVVTGHGASPKDITPEMVFVFSYILTSILFLLLLSNRI